MPMACHRTHTHLYHIQHLDPHSKRINQTMAAYLKHAGTDTQERAWGLCNLMHLSAVYMHISTQHSDTCWPHLYPERLGCRAQQFFCNFPRSAGVARGMHLVVKFMVVMHLCVGWQYALFIASPPSYLPTDCDALQSLIALAARGDIRTPLVLELQVLGAVQLWKKWYNKKWYYLHNPAYSLLHTHLHRMCCSA